MHRQQTNDRPYGGFSESQRRGDRRARIIAAATEIYAEAGFHGAKVRDICIRAGLTNRYFYESFSNLEELFLACHARAVEGLFEILRAEGGAEVASEPRTRRLLHTYFLELQAEPRLAKVFLADIRGISPALDRRADEALLRFADILFEGDSEAGGGECGDRISLVRPALASAVVWIAKTWIASGYATPLETVVNAAMDIMLRQ